MGAFFNSFHVRGKTQQEVHDVLGVLKNQGVSCIIGTESDGWVPVYPEDSGGSDSLAKWTSGMMRTTVVLIDVHDDDVFCYVLYRNGEKIDAFCSDPDYFGSTMTHGGEPMTGHPERFAYLLDKQEDVTALDEILRSMRDHEADFASEPSQEFCDLLRLPNALHSFYYLLGEGVPEGYVRL